MTRGDGWLILAALAAVQPGCRPECLDASSVAVEAAWPGDVGTIRELLRTNPGLATRGECGGRRGLGARLVSRSIGEGSATLLHVAARQGYAELA